MISLIVAYDKNRCIGNNNQIPWKLKSDMLRVKELTTNQTILMGRKTYESIGKALPNRINRVLTRDIKFFADNVEVYNDVNLALGNLQTDKLFIFGGSEIYNLLIDNASELYITEVETEVVGDSYFPEIDLSKWQLVSEKKYKKDDSNEYNYTFLHYLKK